MTDEALRKSHANEWLEVIIYLREGVEVVQKVHYTNIASTLSHAFSQPYFWVPVDEAKDRSEGDAYPVDHILKVSVRRAKE